MAKKTFENAARELIEGVEQTQQAQSTQETHNADNTSYTHKAEKTPRGRKPDGALKKDYRLNLLIARELRDTLQTLADFDRKSLNALINDALAAYAADRKADYETYAAFLEKTAAARKG